MKPTAQELLQTILGEIVDAHIGSDKMEELLVSYAQTYHEEHTQGTIIDIDGQRYNAVLTPYNQPNQ